MLDKCEKHKIPLEKWKNELSILLPPIKQEYTGVISLDYGEELVYNFYCRKCLNEEEERRDILLRIDQKNLTELLQKIGFDPDIFEIKKESLCLGDGLSIAWEMFAFYGGFKHAKNIIDKYDEIIMEEKNLKTM